MQTQPPIWRAVPGFVGLYEASTDGQIRSVDRIVAHRYGTAIKKGKLRKYGLDKNGYPYMALYKGNCDSEQQYVCYWILLTFIGPRPPGMQGCHYDNNPLNNRLDNIRWDTRISNEADKVRHGTSLKGRACPKGENANAAKLSQSLIERIRVLAAQNTMLKKDIAKFFDISKGRLTQILKGRVR